MTALLIPLATDVDDIKIVFSESSLTVLKIVIGLILFGIALDTDVEDFKRAARRPGTIAIGVAAQFIALPAITFLLTLVLDLRGSIALGLILVACCPPGNVSNILTHRARGDVALSVSMTAVSNLLAIVLMPMNVAFWGGLHPTASTLLETIELRPLDMLVEVGLVIGVPFILGLTIRHFWPRIAAGAHRVVGPVSFVGLTAIIVLGVAKNWEIFVDYIGVVLRRRLPARRPGAAPRLLDRSREQTAAGEHEGDDLRGRHPQRRARAAAGVHLLRRTRRDGPGRRLVGDLGHHRRARGRDRLATSDGTGEPAGRWHEGSS